MKIIISPYSKKLRKFTAGEPDRVNPKNYPYWKEVVSILKDKGIYVIQVGINGEDLIGANETRFNLKLNELKILLLDCDAWASVDNFFNHFATFYKKKGVVVWGRSDPNIYGYSENINLLKDRKYLRSNQFHLWEQDEFNIDAFVSPDIVVSAIQSFIT